MTDNHDAEAEVLLKYCEGTKDFTLRDIATINYAISRNLDYGPSLLLWSGVLRVAVEDLYNKNLHLPIIGVEL